MWLSDGISALLLFLLEITYSTLLHPTSTLLLLLSIKGFLKFRATYKSDTKQVELVATNIKKELNKDPLI